MTVKLYTTTVLLSCVTCIGLTGVSNDSSLPASSEWDFVPLETCDVQNGCYLSMLSTIPSISCISHVTYDVIYRNRNY